MSYNPKQTVNSSQPMLQSLLASAAGLLLGILLIGLSTFIIDQPWKSIALELSSVLIVAAIINFVWELQVKRSFADEILAKVGVGQQIRKAGIVSFTANFNYNIEWDQLFRTSRHLDIFFAYGRTWRRTHREELLTFLRRDDAKIRVVLPDPDHESTVEQLATLFRSTKDRVRDDIRQAAIFFEELDNYQNRKVSIWLLPAIPQYSFYILEHFAVIAFSSHQHAPVNVPAWVIEKPSDLYNFVEAEFIAMTDSLATKIY